MEVVYYRTALALVWEHPLGGKSGQEWFVFGWQRKANRFTLLLARHSQPFSPKVRSDRFVEGLVMAPGTRSKEKKNRDTQTDMKSIPHHTIESPQDMGKM